jgi:xylan 1,4-beta-xylosidase
VVAASRARLASAWPLLAALLTVPCSVRAQAPAAVSVSVDATDVGTPLEPVWPFYGYDEINYTTSPEGKALLDALVAGNTAPVHVRSHFLFNSGDGTPAMKWGSTNVYSEDDAGNPVYDWRLTDGILDALSGAGAYPFVELGFMPEALSSHPAPYRNSSSTMLDSGCFYPPTDYVKWADLIRTWAVHARDRYPDAEASWLWELWNEPDLPYWNGTLDEYTKLYDYTEAALHEALPKAALGGPAVAGAAGTFLKQFLQHCADGANAVTGEAGTRLDLVTFHAKGGVAIAGDHVQMDLGSQLRQHRAGFKAVAAFPQFKQTPIYVTEADPDACAACPASSRPANQYRNSPAYGAYELAMMKRTLELEADVGIKLGGLLTWAFTFPGTPYFAGYRTLATNGINLPVLSAFKLLGRLAGTRLPLSSTGARPLDDLLTSGVGDQPELDGMATSSGDAIQVLVWNYHDDLVAAPATPVHLTITVPQSFGSHARVSHLRVDEAHGDAYTVWVSQGSPATPTAGQVSALKKAMEPSSLVPDRVVALPASGSLDFDFDLPRFGVSLVTLLPATAGGDDGPTSTSPTPGACACRVGHRDTTPAPLGFAALALATWGLRRRAATSTKTPDRARP